MMILSGKKLASTITSMVYLMSWIFPSVRMSMTWYKLMCILLLMNSNT